MHNKLFVLMPNCWDDIQAYYAYVAKKSKTANSTWKRIRARQDVYLCTQENKFAMDSICDTERHSRGCRLFSWVQNK